MSTFIRGVNLSKKWLRVVIFTIMAVVCATAITLGVILSQKPNFAVQPETNNKLEVLDSKALFSANGLDEEIANALIKNVSLYGDNVALGNAGGNIVSSVIQLGGFKWTVVYIQNDILTLYANEPIVTMSFGSGTNYSQSAVRDYLLNEFYPQFLQNIGYDGFDSLVVAYGDDALFYQDLGAQAVVLNTLNNGKISNNDGIKGDKIWLPSAYEVGGFANTDYSPKSRVNSFKTIQADGFTINSGLWNTSNEIRLAAGNAWLRSSVDNDVASLTNGVISKTNKNIELAVRPCINIVLPTTSQNQVVTASADEQVLQSGVLTASVDYSDAFNQSEGLTTTAVKRDGTSSKPFRISKAETLSLLSDAVMAGQNMAGLYFELAANIDMSGVTVWSPIGRTGFPFKGIFLGNGYTISNLASAGSGLAGLFGVIENATIKQVGIINSTWYTTNSDVGVIACYAKSSLIAQCYSDCGVSGLNYIGGIVGRIESSTSSVSATTVDNATLGVINCYNLHGITGRDYVGGIAGEATGSLIGNCYNTGSISVTNGSSYGGIAGAGTSGNILNCFVYNSNNNFGTLISSYETMRTKATFTNWKFKTSSTTVATNPWFMSNVVNDRLPMLYVFMKNATINVKSSVSNCTAQVNNLSTYTGNIGASVTITATPAYTTGSHYKFVGWYHYDLDNSGNMMQTDRAFTAAGTNTTYSFSLDDYYNLEARFVRLFKVEVTPLFNGFSASYTKPNYSVTSDKAAIVDNGNWYEEGTVITINIGDNAQRIFTSMAWGRSSTSITNNIAINAGNDFVKVVDGTYQITVNNNKPDLSFGSGDEFYLRPVLNRVYSVVTEVSLPSTYPASDPKPSSRIAFTEAGGSATSVTNGGASKKVLYNGSITATTENVNTNKLTFSRWELYADTTKITASISSGVSFALSGITVSSDSVTTLKFVANFTLAKKEIIIEEYYNSAKKDAAGKVILSLTSLNRSSLGSSSQVAKLQNIPYYNDVYLYVLPSFETGFDYLSNTVLSASGVTLTFDATNSVWYTQQPFKASFDGASATYKVTYKEVSTYVMNFSITVDGTNPPANVFTLNKTTANNLTLNTSIASGYTVTVSDDNWQKYYLKNVNVTISGTTKTVYTRTPASGNIYAGTQGAQNIFENMTTNQNGTKLLKDLYTIAGVTPTASNTTVAITVNFIKITRSITVNTMLGVSGANYVTDSTLSDKYAISATGVTNGKAGSDYILDDNITLIATAGSIGYKVASITISGPTGNVSYTSQNFNNSATLTFKLTANATITIKFDIHTYKVAITDNLTLPTSSTITGTTIKGLGLSVSNTYKYAVAAPNTASGTYTGELTLKYADVLTISNYSTLFDVTISGISRKAILESIVIRNDADNTTVNYSAVNPFTPSDLFKDARDDVTIIFNYKLLQALSVTYADSISGASSAALVILVNKNNSNDRIVVIVPQGNTVNVESQVGEYKLYTVLPIFIKTNTSVTGGTGSTSGNDYIVSVADSVANNIKIEVSEIISGNDSIYGSDIF